MEEANTSPNQLLLEKEKGITLGKSWVTVDLVYNANYHDFQNFHQNMKHSMNWIKVSMSTAVEEVFFLRNTSHSPRFIPARTICSQARLIGRLTLFPSRIVQRNSREGGFPLIPAHHPILLHRPFTKGQWRNKQLQDSTPALQRTLVND